MPENAVIVLSGIEPFEWSVKVYPSRITGLYHAVVKVGTWSAVGQEYVSKNEAKQEGFSMLANMVAELEDVVNG